MTRVDGVEPPHYQADAVTGTTSRRWRLKFYFHTGGSKEFMASVAGQLASYGVPQSRLAFESFGPSEAGEVLAQAA